MPPLIDLTGQTFGWLEVIGRAPNRGKEPHWVCQCQCAHAVVVRGLHLRSGNTKSCGCLKRELCRPRFKTHGLSQALPRLYRIWVGMRERCLNPRHVRYRRYGGSGITVSSGWHGYAAFHEWATTNGYREDLSIDRINNDGNYEPNNCRWATPKDQARNTSRKRLITLNGETKSLAQWSSDTGIPRTTLSSRIATQTVDEKVMAALAAREQVVESVMRRGLK